jgi:excisionase family DNA binding protein
MSTEHELFGAGEWLSEGEIAASMHVSKATVQRWRKYLGLKAFKAGRFWKIRRTWLEEWLEAKAANANLPTLFNPRQAEVPKVQRANSHDARLRAMELLNGSGNSCVTGLPQPT